MSSPPNSVKAMKPCRKETVIPEQPLKKKAAFQCQQRGGIGIVIFHHAKEKPIPERTTKFFITHKNYSKTNGLTKSSLACISTLTKTDLML